MLTLRTKTRHLHGVASVKLLLTQFTTHVCLQVSLTHLTVHLITDVELADVGTHRLELIQLGLWFELRSLHFLDVFIRVEELWPLLHVVIILSNHQLVVKTLILSLNQFLCFLIALEGLNVHPLFHDLYSIVKQLSRENLVVGALRRLNITLIRLVRLILVHDGLDVLRYLNQKLHSCLLHLPSVDEKVRHDCQELSEMALTE